MLETGCRNLNLALSLSRREVIRAGSLGLQTGRFWSMISGRMANQTISKPNRKAKKSYTLSPESVAFLEAVRTGQPSPINPDDAAHVTRVTFAAVESIRTGLPVQLS